MQMASLWMRAVLITVLTLGTSVCPVWAKDTVSPAIAFGASAAVSPILDDIKAKLQTIISEAQSAGTAVSFRVASDAQLLLQNLNNMASELEGKTFKDLNQTQTNAIANLSAATSAAQRELAQNLDKLDMAIKDAGAELSRVPGVSKRPFLFHVRPAYILKGSGSFELELAGSLLNSSEASLTFDKVSCQLRSGTEMNAHFSCPSDVFKAASDGWAQGQLTLIKRNLALFKKRYTYQVAVRAIDPVLGHYSLSVTRQIDSTNIVARTATNSHQNGHCEGDRAVRWTYSPGAGCQVDVSSVLVQEGHSSQSSYGGVDNLSATGFQVYGTVRNNGHCVGFIKDGRGSLGVTVNWKDLCPVHTEVDDPAAQGEILWADQHVFTLPANTSKFTLKLTQANGAERIVTNTIDAGWYTAHYDPVTRILVIRPRALDEALSGESLNAAPH